MSTAVTWIIALLAAIVLLLVYIAIRIAWAFRALNSKRIDVYTAHLGELHETMHALRRQERPPDLDTNLSGQFDLIASFPTMRLSGEVLNAFGDITRKTKESAPASEISFAVQSAEQALVALNVSMRDDLALNFGEGRFPGAEVFRRSRGKGAEIDRDV